jgi:hypothetical protein
MQEQDPQSAIVHDDLESEAPPMYVEPADSSAVSAPADSASPAILPIPDVSGPANDHEKETEEVEKAAGG